MPGKPTDKAWLHKASQTWCITLDGKRQYLDCDYKVACHKVRKLRADQKPATALCLSGFGFPIHKPTVREIRIVAVRGSDGQPATRRLPATAPDDANTKSRRDNLLIGFSSR